jgi:hypothetical protein
VTVNGGVVSYTAFTGSHFGHTKERIEHGQLVSMTGENLRAPAGPQSEIIYGIELTTKANDSRCLGAYLGLEEPKRPASNENPHLIMAVGNGELWVIDEGQGDIEPGDFLISSSVPGCTIKDDPTRFPVGYICARAAERVHWSTDSKRRRKISVLFETFVRDSRGLVMSESVRILQAENQALRQELKSLHSLSNRLARLEALIENPASTFAAWR